MTKADEGEARRVKAGPRMRRAGTRKLKRRAGPGMALDRPVSDQREAFAQLLALTAAVMPDHACEPSELAGHAGLQIQPRRDRTPVVRSLVFIHGGGYSLGSPTTHRPLAARLAHALGAPTWMLAYRRAPEHPYPAALDDLRAQWAALDPSLRAGAILAGDSAGGGLALALAMDLRDRGETLPRGLVLMSPWIDLTMSGPSVDANAAREVLFTREGLELMARRYAGAMDCADPRVSPLFASFEGLPPMLLQAGGDEMLLDDAREAGRRAREAGVDVEVQVYPDQGHVFQATPMLGAGAEAIAAIREWVVAQSPA